MNSTPNFKADISMPTRHVDRAGQCAHLRCNSMTTHGYETEGNNNNYDDNIDTLISMFRSLSFYVLYE